MHPFPSFLCTLLTKKDAKEKESEKDSEKEEEKKVKKITKSRYLDPD
jgi:hypothetical protein